MIRWILLLLGAFIFYTLIRNEGRKRSADKDKDRNAGQGKDAANMVKDPECGTYVDATKSISVRDGDAVYRFCSYECRDAFLKKLQQDGRKIPELRKEE
jgi:YHS domain-containing protein